MKDADIVKNLLEAEYQAKILIEEAERNTSARIVRVQHDMQEQFDTLRREKFRELEKDRVRFAEALRKERDVELEEFENHLKSMKTYPEDAAETARKLLFDR